MSNVLEGYPCIPTGECATLFFFGSKSQLNINYKKIYY